MKNSYERYQEFFQLFEREEYFQSHEVLEEIWIVETERKSKNHPAIVLLQFAVAMLHWKRGNIKGATMVLKSALSHLEKTEEKMESLGVEEKNWKTSLKIQ